MRSCEYGTAVLVGLKEVAAIEDVGISDFFVALFQQAHVDRIRIAHVFEFVFGSGNLWVLLLNLMRL